MSVEAKVTLREIWCCSIACQSPWPFQRALFLWCVCCSHLSSPKGGFKWWRGKTKNKHKKLTNTTAYCKLMLTMSTLINARNAWGIEGGKSDDMEYSLSYIPFSWSTWRRAVTAVVDQSTEPVHLPFLKWLLCGLLHRWSIRTGGKLLLAKVAEFNIIAIRVYFKK